MGWSVGSEILELVVSNIKKAIPTKKARIRVYKKLIKDFEDYDCDTICEIVDGKGMKEFREAYYAVHPEEAYSDDEIDDYYFQA